MTQREFSPYAPVRLRDSAWWRRSAEAADKGFVQRNGQVASNLPDLIMRDLIQPAMRIAVEEADREGSREHLGQLFAKLLQMRHWVPLIGQYHANGKQIFDLNDNIVGMLRITDVSDCNLLDWHPPYDSFFVRFGKQDDMMLQFGSGFEYLDGAFVAVTPWNEAGERRLKIGLTTVKDDGSGVMMPGYFIDFTPAEQAMSPRDAVMAFIARKAADLEADPDQSDRNKTLIEIRKAEFREGADLLQRAIELVVNCLFYIESMGSEKEPSPGRDVPVDLLVKWQQAPHLRKFKAIQKIGADGYVMVRMLGDEAQPGGPAPTGARADVTTHWRRGHWRLQHHGPQNSLSKRVWIRPVMVNPGKQHEDLPGHVYAVGGSGKHVH